MTFVTSSPGADPIIVEASFPRAASAVFAAWTDPAQISSWFGAQDGELANASVDLRPGGGWRFTETEDEFGAVGFEGEYLRIEPAERLVFTWRKFATLADGQRETTDPSRVEITFFERAATTLMTITHSALDDETRIGFRVGWELGTTNLVKYLYGPENTPPAAVPPS